LEQIKPLIDKERSNSIGNASGITKNTAKVVPNASQPRDSQVRLAKLSGNPTQKPVTRVVSVIGKTSQSVSQERTTAATSSAINSMQTSSRGMKSNYLTSNLNLNADKNVRNSFVGNSNPSVLSVRGSNIGNAPQLGKDEPSIAGQQNLHLLQKQIKVSTNSLGSA
jgi:hypothetical protein